ncbi:SHOCT domain-containing protein [Microbacterium aquilitoris]|uniref:SHOCT domain-containing protein n=1 Tax=Microbacterium aquilitoris TaxID=3067307 RepID=A0ABU3GJY4_9MICO|nr:MULTISPECIES: SHOCT domain-containing protein [unclassified Microbacterium]MDT3331016.1 SHOCT domain-containing protein [Microbacterium sp. KSW-18]MDT3344210.1 SHOCT domain-containing protein [Microbacterium sp. KSW2-22]
MMVPGGVVAHVLSAPVMPIPDDGDSGFFGPGMPGPDMGGAGDAFSAFFGLAVVLVIAGAVFSVVVAARKRRILRDAGIDPFTVDAAIAAKVLRSDLLAPSTPAAQVAPSIEKRLAELDDLRARGVISEDEHREARAAVLKG